MIIKGKSEEFKKLAESIAKLTGTKVVEDEFGRVGVCVEDKRIDIHITSSHEFAKGLAHEIHRNNKDKLVLVGDSYHKDEGVSDYDIWVFDVQYYDAVGIVRDLDEK